MQISWIQKTTLLDYPDKVATIIFTLWCNFRCHYCHNFEFVLPEKAKKFLNDLITEEAFFNFLEQRKEFLDGVVISGGEPTLQKDLYEFVKKIKEMWFLVKLDTNGRDPRLLRKMIDEKLIDYVAMDIKNPIEKYHKIVNSEFNKNDILESISILLEEKIDYEFRSTVVKWVHGSEEIEDMAKMIEWASKYFLQNYEDKNILNIFFKWERFNPEELRLHKKVAEKYVKKCNIRS